MTRFPQLINSVGNLQLEVGLICVIRALFDPARKFSHLVINRAAFLDEFANLLVRIHHRRMVTVSKKLADFRERQVRHLSRKIHCNLASQGDGL